ncbi:YdcF family protein [Candidatus Peribacteria bacterium]|nr:YdcF family protein [Candidatus Peribacteria bacterium]
MLVIRINTLQAAERVWEYLCSADALPEPLQTDAIIGIGSHDIRTAETCIRLQKETGAPLYFSGGYGRITQFTQQLSEAETFAQYAVQLGVAPESIRTRTTGMTTEENIAHLVPLLQVEDYQHLTLVHKPYMLRITRAYAERYLPQYAKTYTCCTQDLALYTRYESSLIADYTQSTYDLLVDDLYRYRQYAIAQGLAVPPAEVETAWQHLVDAGYTRMVAF